MKPVRVVIAEMDEAQRKELVRQLKTHDEIEVAGETDNGLDAIRMLFELEPDVLVSNMIMPRHDGFMLLDQIAFLPQNKRPVFIALTAQNTENAIRKAFEKGASEYLIKPVEADVLVGKILDHFHKRMESKEIRSNGFCSTNDERKQITHRISSLFMRIGLPAHLRGFKFARYAIACVVKEPALIDNRTKVLYPMVAKEFETSTFCVERAIRHVITLTWDRGIAARYEKTQSESTALHLPQDKPTSGEFIALVAEYISQFPESVD